MVSLSSVSVSFNQLLFQSVVDGLSRSGSESGSVIACCCELLQSPTLSHTFTSKYDTVVSTCILFKLCMLQIFINDTITIKY